MFYELKGKRAFDVATASIALVLLSPLMASVALAIALEDGLPILFRQTRIGRDGAAFEFLKFRSMPVGTRQIASGEAEALVPTRVGRVIRRTSVDELPQLVNIMRGDMSVVGPRPPIPDQTSLIDARRATGALRLRPGLTGLAQIRSYDGMPPEEKASWDATYAGRITFAGDMRIVIETLGYLRRPPPTY